MIELDELRAQIRSEAERCQMPIDAEVYARAGRACTEPILYAGSLSARVAFFARDLGRDEVLCGEPLIGGAGQRVRRAVYRALFDGEPSKEDRRLIEALDHILLTNTVPYKPVGNKAYAASVKARFRPFIERLLVDHWRGDYIITMGNEAFLWFAPYVGKEAIDAFWTRDDRYEAELRCVVTSTIDGVHHCKAVTLAPLPHPSPLNRAYLARFPQMLELRLAKSPLQSTE